MIEFGLFNPTVCAKLCLTLLHSLWQIATLFALACLIERLVCRWLPRGVASPGRPSVEVSYLLHVGALCAALAVLPVTYVLVDTPPMNVRTANAATALSTTPTPGAPQVSVSSVPARPDVMVQSPDIVVHNEHGQFLPSTLPARASSRNDDTPATTSAAVLGQQTPLPAEGVSKAWVDVAPWIVIGYAAGVVMMLLRLLLAIGRSSRLIASATFLSEGSLVSALKSRAQRWSMHVVPLLAVAEQTIIPQIVGLWRPVILLPAAIVSGMPTEQLELILAHEMAHLRRHDLWVNLLQRLAESFLFFNPGLWYLNRRISMLREYCCDDLTCQHDSPAQRDSEPQLQYAAALLKVVELCAPGRVAQADLATLAAGGNSPSELRRRIARLFGEPLREPVGMTRGGLLAILGVLLLLVGPALWPVSGADNENAQDVVELAQNADDQNTATANSPAVAESEETPATDATAKDQTEPQNKDDAKAQQKNRVLRGRITDQEGQPVADVKVTLYSGVATRFRGQETTTNANGEYRFDPHTTMQRFVGFEKVRATTGITFTHADFVPQDGKSFRDIPISSHEEVFDLVMVRGGRVKGVLKNHETGQPIAGQSLRMSDGFFKGRKDSRFTIYATTNDAGEFAFEPAPPAKYVIEINDNDYQGKHWYLKIGQVDVKVGATAKLELNDAGLKQLEDPFRIKGSAIGNDGHSMVYGGVGIKLVGSDKQLRSRGGGIDGRNVWGLSFGPIERSEPTDGAPYGVGTHDVEIFGNNTRYGYRLISRTPSEPLRITDDPNKPEVENGIRYIRPNQLLEFELVYAPDDNLSRLFSLKVVGPDGSPVPHAKVQIRSNPAVTKEQVHRGEFVKEGSYGNAVVANDEGELRFTLSSRPTRFNLNIQHPGFAPYWADFTSGNYRVEIPDRFTATLDAGWIVGGIVIDEKGNPVEGAQVKPSVKYKKRPGDTSSLGVGTRIKTDADGKWRFECVPASKQDVHVEVSHPRFQPHYQRLARDTFGLEGDAEPSGKIQLRPGLTVSGTVTDEAGRPIAGALVRTKFLNDLREATTNKQGVYRLEGCDAKMTRIVVSAPGKATDLQEVQVAPDMLPVNFVMKPGGHVKIRVVDENGKAIPKARIFYQDWRRGNAYWEFDHKHDYADENGVWEWNEAPLDEFTADICRPGGMQLSERPLLARAEEYVFTPPRALVVHGSVVDAKTKQPIPEFKVIAGLRNQNSRIDVSWGRRGSFEAKDGRYQVRQTEDAIAHLVRIEAAGYKVAISRDIKSDEGKIEINFELTAAEDIAAKVQTAAGLPAAGAKVALGVAGSQISLEDGKIDDGSTYATRVDTDAAGDFSIPWQEESFQLVITHAAGFAHIKIPEQTIGDVITLTPWARVEGTFRIGPTPMPNIVLESYSSGLHSYGDGVPRIFTHERAVTGKGGRFVFPRMIPGTGRIGRTINLTVDDGATEVTSSIRQPVTLVSGQTTNLNLGGNGRPVVGKLAPPTDYTEKVLWNFATIDVEADFQRPQLPDPPAEVRDDPVKRQAWWKAWEATDEGMKWIATYREIERRRNEYPVMSATVDGDGTFRIDDVPPGNWRLSVHYNRQPSPGSLRDVQFKLPPIDGKSSDEVLQLGTLVLE